jgi:hypothetical protein
MLEYDNINISSEQNLGSPISFSVRELDFVSLFGVSSGTANSNIRLKNPFLPLVMFFTIFLYKERLN